MLKRLDHIGIIVKDLQKAQKGYAGALALKAGGAEELPTAKVAFLPIGETNIELIEPTAKEGFLAEHLREQGEGIHHLCFEVEDIEGLVAGLLKQGVRMRDQKPRPGSRGSRVAFAEPEAFGGVIIEFCQFPKP